MTYLLFAVALSLSAVAAYYAVAGLVAIFAAAAIPIIIMGSLLEASKLVVASWLYRNWVEIPKLFKAYFLTALITLMLLTSMGIFGFLSKAHLDQAIPTGDVSAKLALIDEKIKTQKENINASRKELTQLDAQVDQTLSRTTDAKGTERAITVRRAQQKDRARILSEIGTAQTTIAKLNEERAPIAAEVREIEAEVGPIKYIAALIYGDNPDNDLLEKSVRWVIIMIVLVFDPLAVLMLVAANWNLKKEEIVKPIPVEEPINNNLQTTDDIELSDSVQVSKDSEDLNIQVDEPTKDWEPELYKRMETETPKAKSFLDKVQNMLGVKTIEKEVEELQPSEKGVGYDSAGRRTTP
jgi:hypothetical protein